MPGGGSQDGLVPLHDLDAKKTGQGNIFGGVRMSVCTVYLPIFYIIEYCTA